MPVDSLIPIALMWGGFSLLVGIIFGKDSDPGSTDESFAAGIVVWGIFGSILILLYVLAQHLYVRLV